LAGASDTFLQMKGHEILFSVSLCLSLLLLALQASMAQHSPRQFISSKLRIAVRVVVAVSILFLPMGTFGLGGLVLVGFAAVLMISLALFEMVAILPDSDSSEDLSAALERISTTSTESLRDLVDKAYADWNK